MLTSGGAEGPPPPEFGVGVVRAITTGALFWIHKVRWDNTYKNWTYTGRWNPDAHGESDLPPCTYPLYSQSCKSLRWEQIPVEEAARMILAR